jgi:hypothetical protein
MKFNKNYRKSNNALPGNHVTNNVYNGKNSRVSLMHYLDSVPPMTQRDNVPDEQPETKEEEEDLPNIFNEAVEDSPSDSSTSKETDLDKSSNMADDTATVTQFQHGIYSTSRLNPQRSIHLPTWKTNINQIQTR